MHDCEIQYIFGLFETLAVKDQPLAIGMYTTLSELNLHFRVQVLVHFMTIKSRETIKLNKFNQ